MSRNIAPEVLDAYRKDRFQRAFLCYIDYPTQPVFYNNRTFPIPFDWDGNGEQIFEGVGNFASLTTLNELVERRVQRITLALSGLNPDILEEHLSEDYMGRLGLLWEMALDDDWQPIGAAAVFAGNIASQRVRMGYEAAVSVTLASVEEDWETVRASSYNSRDQRRIAGRESDKGLDYVEEFAQGRKIKWGKS